MKAIAMDGRMLALCGMLVSLGLPASAAFALPSAPEKSAIAPLALVSPVIADEADPLNSPLWGYLRQRFIGSDPYHFDSRVKVAVPPFAEDPTQVPISIDASALDGNIERILVWADLNPIQHIVTLYPHSDVVRPRLSLRIKVEQGTAVRAAVLTSDGLWHIGGSYLDASGGGCTAPSMAAGNPYWESHLGEVQARLFPASGAGSIAAASTTAQAEAATEPGLQAATLGRDDARYKFRVIHPMDTGLVAGIPEFYIEQAQLRGAGGEPLMRLELSAPVSENPVLTFDTGTEQDVRLWLRDNNGNEFESVLSPSRQKTGG